MAEIVRAFIARSFAEQDSERIRPLLDFLKTFENLGFFCRSAEPAEAEEVSEKIKGLIRESQVFIGIFTRKYPIFAGDGAANPEAKPSAWTAPSWVLQESGFARGLANKKLVFFVEPGVELPKLAGDLEYIEYDSKVPDRAFRRINESLGKIIRESLALTVEPTIRQESQAPPPESEPEKEKKPEGVGIMPYFTALLDSLGTGDESSATRAFEDGLQYSRTSGKFDEVTWKAFYELERAENGFPDGIEHLQTLETEYPDSDVPPAFLASCFRHFGDVTRAVEAYERAHQKAPAEKKTSYLVSAAECLHVSKDWFPARALLLEGLTLAKGKWKLDALSKLYENLKGAGSKYDGFAVAEYSLRENGAQMDLRFRLAYDYEEAGMHDLAAYHYRELLTQRTDQSGAMNNLAVVFWELELPIHAVDLYKQAFDSGNTLAAGNLAYRYLNTGMVNEAKEVVARALKSADPDPTVAEALAAIGRGRSDEGERLDKLVGEADGKREFFIGMGQATLTPTDVDINGNWLFPTAQLTLKRDGNVVTGSGVKHIYPSSFETAFGHYDKDQPYKHETFELNGTLVGRVCTFGLSSQQRYASGYVSPYDHPVSRKGFLVFAEDGKAVKVLEIEPKFELYEVSRSERTGTEQQPKALKAQE